MAEKWNNSKQWDQNYEAARHSAERNRYLKFPTNNHETRYLVSCLQQQSNRVKIPDKQARSSQVEEGFGTI
jgi:hypothetical protein